MTRPTAFDRNGRGKVLPLTAALIFLAGTAAASGTKPQKWDGSRTTPVHQIPLKDELGQPIVPNESNPLPFSARYTCAPCHDYDVIKAGRHFNAGSSTPAGRPGEPWVWVDERTGTQIPLSYRPWPGVFDPKALGLSGWDFAILFGRHSPGGGTSEPAEGEMTPGSRWEVSGKLEINCLACHNASRLQSHSEWAKQVIRQNFRWAATAAAGLGEVGGISSRLAPTWDVFDGPDPDDSEWAVAPSVKYDRKLFDSKHRAFLDIAYPPDDARCLACHSTAPSNQKKFQFDDDVHSAAGIKCAQCHRNDVSHAMVRGYEGEAADDPSLLAEDFTCRGCHLGGRSAKKEVLRPGRLGAPYPLHKGIPEVHFERLSCTVCHSGPLPASEPERVRSARANRLGIFGVANWATDLPAILEPVYLRDANGKLAPHRMMWPAYWGKLEKGAVSLLKPEEVAATAGDILYPERTVTRILAALAGTSDLEGVSVLVLNGKVFQVNVDGGLDASTTPVNAAPPSLAWALLKDGRIEPLLPEFDPSNAETTVEPEARVQKVLEALKASEAAPGEPILIYKSTRYRIVDNALEKTERKEDAAAVQGLVWLAKDGSLLPFLPEFEKAAVEALTGSDRTLTEPQVERVLKTLTGKPESSGATFVYLSGGTLFKLDPKGRLEGRADKSAEPVAWPLAHQVRPARQALGVDGCTDCHKGTSDFFFASVEGQGPLQTRNVTEKSASSYMKLSGPYHLMFGLSFAVRPWFKLVLGIAAFAVGSLLLAAFLLAVGRASGLIEKRR